MQLKKQILLILIIILMETLSQDICKGEELIIPYNISEVPNFYTIENATEISSNILINNPLVKGTDITGDARDNLLKYIFGSAFELSYKFLFCVLIWILILATIILVQRKLNYSNKIKLLISLILTILIANLGFNSYISNLIISYVNTELSRILLIILMLFTFFIEVFFIIKKKNNLPLQNPVLTLV